MGIRIADLQKMKQDRLSVHLGVRLISVQDGLTPTQYSAALRAYFMAFGEFVHISTVDSELYVRLGE